MYHTLYKILTPVNTSYCHIKFYNYIAVLLLFKNVCVCVCVCACVCICVNIKFEKTKYSGGVFIYMIICACWTFFCPTIFRAMLECDVIMLHLKIIFKWKKFNKKNVKIFSVRI